MRTQALAAVAALISTGVVVSTGSTIQAASTTQAGQTHGSATAARPATGAALTLGYDNTKVPTSIGYGGAISTVDPTASQVGLAVLSKGGNAVDAAVAAAATLGVTEPFSAGIGGGGYFVHYDAATGQVETIDGRETAPAEMPNDAFIDPATGLPYNFSPELVTSGVSVGVPGTLATWQRAIDRWGSTSLATALAPATKVARHGFVVDETFRGQTAQNEVRFNAFTSTRKLYWAGGHAPEVGSIFRNPDLAKTYDLIARKGVDAFYRGRLADEIVRAVRKPPKTETTDLPIPPGFMRASDLARYRTVVQRPTHVGYRGYGVYGMAPSSSGGSTVGEALNILETFDLAGMDDVAALHRYLGAGELAFADRAAYVGDPAYVDVPLSDLLSDRYAKERACLIVPDHAITPMPTTAGDVTSYDGVCDNAAQETAPADDTENTSTTNLTVSDRWGNVVEYTLTIEQTGGSGIVVPGRGFLLNNELTDFSTTYVATDPNRIQPGKRPRSSMSPTILLRHGKPFLALGSPGGSTIITTVLQMLFNRLDRGMTIEEALAAPRAAPRNGAAVSAEPGFLSAYETDLEALGHDLVLSQDPFTGTTEIGAATAIEFGRHGLLTAVSEPVRRGGGSALVVQPIE